MISIDAGRFGLIERALCVVAALASIGACNGYDSSVEPVAGGQQGLTAQFSATDSTIRQDLGNQGGQPDCLARSDRGHLAGMSCLLHFGLMNIPANAKVMSVSIRFRLLNSSPQTFNLHPLLSAWDEDTVTWTHRTANATWATPGATGATDRGPTFLNVVMGNTGTFTVNFNVAGLQLVKSWITNPSTNHGISITSDLNTDGIGVASAQHPTISYRPVMTVNYSTPFGPDGSI